MSVKEISIEKYDENKENYEINMATIESKKVVGNKEKECEDWGDLMIGNEL